MDKDGEPGLRGAGRAGEGSCRSRARTSESRPWPGGSRRIRRRAWRVSLARDGDQAPPQGGDHGLAAADAVACQMSSPAARAVSWSSQAAMLAASSAPHIQAIQSAMSLGRPAAGAGGDARRASCGCWDLERRRLGRGHLAGGDLGQVQRGWHVGRIPLRGRGIGPDEFQ